jgi:hypothetical protein
VAARVGQTLAHIGLPSTNAATILRFALFCVQVVYMTGMAIVAGSWRCADLDVSLDRARPRHERTDRPMAWMISPVNDVEAKAGQCDIKHLDQFAGLELACDQNVAA